MYIVGLSACVYHFANGLWTAAISWGLTVSRPAQRRWGFVCAVFGVLLDAAEIASAVAFWRYDLGSHVPGSKPRVLHVQQSDGEQTTPVADQLILTEGL
jgi:hypothetical protein